MPSLLNILLIGTCDTKADEILFIRSCLEGQGATVAIMDVGVLGKPRFQADYPNDAVAAAAGTTLADIVALGDENLAMTKVAEGAVALTRRLYGEGDERIRERNLWHAHRMFARRQRVVGVRVAELGNAADVAGVQARNFDAVAPQGHGEM